MGDSVDDMQRRARAPAWAPSIYARDGYRMPAVADPWKGTDTVWIAEAVGDWRALLEDDFINAMGRRSPVDSGLAAGALVAAGLLPRLAMHLCQAMISLAAQDRFEEIMTKKLRPGGPIRANIRAARAAFGLWPGENPHWRSRLACDVKAPVPPARRGDECARCGLAAIFLFANDALERREEWEQVAELRRLYESIAGILGPRSVLSPKIGADWAAAEILIWADWLEERGMATQADAIRGLVEIHSKGGASR